MPIAQNSTIWYNPQDYNAPSDPTQDSSAAFQAIISATGGNPAPVIITKPYLLKTNLGFTSNLQLYFPNGGQLIADVGVTPQINSEIIASPYSFILDSSRAGAQFLGGAKVNQVWADWFGASPTTTADDTLATNDAAVFAAQSSHADVCFNFGTYNYNAQLFGNGALGKSFDYCNWKGMGKRKTIFNYPTLTAGLALIVVQGGSGQATDMKIEGIQFNGNFDGTNGTYAVQLRGIGDVQIVRCKFGANRRAGLASNIDGLGSFTEYDVFVEPEFTTACGGALELQRTSGDDSFHGTGIRRMLNNASPSEDVVTIGAGCKMYNSEVSGQIWTNGGAVNVFKNNSGQPTTTHGDVTIEVRASDSLAMAAGTSLVRRTGGIIGTGTNVSAGLAISARDILINSDSSVTALGCRQAYIGAMTTGANVVPTAMTTLNRFIDVTFFGSPASSYRYRYKLAVSHNGFGGAGYVRSTIGTTDGTAGGPFQPMEALNGLAYGAPTFTVNSSGVLIATNGAWPVSGISCLVEELETSSDIGTAVRI